MLTQNRIDSQTATLPAPRPAVVRVLFLGMCLVVAYATLLPFRFTLERVLAGGEGLPHLALQTRSPTPLSDLIGNVALFVPVGALAWLGFRGARGKLGALARATLAGTALSFAIEVAQCFTPTRTPSVSDVFANGLGSFVGALAALVTWPRLRTLPSVATLVRSSRHEPLLLAMAGLVVLISVQAFVPFDYSLHPHVLRRALRMAQLDPRLDPAPWIDPSRLLLFALLGGVTYRVTQLLSMRRVAARVATSLGLVAALALVLEGAQILFKSQVMAVQDGLSAIAGGGIGVVMAVWVTRGSVARASWCVVTFTYATSLLFTTGGAFGAQAVEALQVRLQALIPLYAENFAANLADVSVFTETFLLFVPLGFLLAREFASRWRQLPWNAVLVVLACAAWGALPHLLQRSDAAGLSLLAWIVAPGLGGFVGGTSWLWFEASREAHGHSRPEGDRSRAGWRDCVESAP